MNIQIFKRLNFISLCMLSFFASSTTLNKLQFNEVVNAATVGVLGEKTSTDYIVENGATYTVTTFKINEVAFGDVGQTIKVKTNGGLQRKAKISAIEIEAGSPNFFNNTQSLLLLIENDDDTFSIVGYSQGVLPVTTSSVGDTIKFPDNFGQFSVNSAMSRISQMRARDNTSNITK